MANIKDMTGQKFGRILVISYSHISNHEAMWNCKCDCGKEWLVSGHNLRAGNIQSCGCLRNENTGKRFLKKGLSTTRLYNIWRGMRKRCNNPNEKSYKFYGAKGIKVCEEWNDFEIFYEWAMNSGYTDNLTIDRKDNKKNYCPENCQWLTRTENTRKATKKGGLRP